MGKTVDGLYFAMSAADMLGSGYGGTISGAGINVVGGLGGRGYVIVVGVGETRLGLISGSPFVSFPGLRCCARRR